MTVMSRITISIVCFSFLITGFKATLTAGQGGVIGILGTPPGLHVANQWGKCVSRSGDVRMSFDNYIEKSKGGLRCLFSSTGEGSFDIMLSNEKVASYHYTIGGGGNTIRNTYLKPGWTQARQFFPAPGNGFQHSYLVGLHNGSTSNWMAAHAGQLGQLRLMDIVLPGTHDSGTYAISGSSPVMPDADSDVAKIAKWVPMSRGAIAGWAKTQTLTTLEQLERGIRYFDLRLAAKQYNPHPKDIYATHSLAGASLAQILSDLVTFLGRTENRREIVVLDMNHWYNEVDVPHAVESVQHRAFASFKETFRDRIISRKDFSPTSTLNEIWEKGGQVIISAPPDADREHADFVWTTRSGGLPTEEAAKDADFYTYWPNKQNADDIKRSLVEAFNAINRIKDREFIYIIQAQGTPVNQTVKDGLNPVKTAPRNLVEFTGPIKQRMTEFLLSADTPVPKGSIIIEDFTMGVDLVALCLRRTLPNGANELLESGFSYIDTPGSRFHPELGWIHVPEQAAPTAMTTAAATESPPGRWFYMLEDDIWAYSSWEVWPNLYQSSNGTLPFEASGWVYRHTDHRGEFLYDFSTGQWQPMAGL